MARAPDYSDLADDYETGLLECADVAPYDSYPRFGPKRGGSDLPRHCGERSGSLMSGRACHAQCYTGLSRLCPVLFFGNGCKGWLDEYLQVLFGNLKLKNILFPICSDN